MEKSSEKTREIVELCVLFYFSNKRKYGILKPGQKKGGVIVSEKERIAELEEENRRLKRDNDMLLEIMAQMRVTLNRLLIRYVTAGSESR